MLNLLTSHGSLIITVLLGYNPEIDDLILNNSFNFHILFLERYSKFNKRIDTSKDLALQKNTALGIQMQTQLQSFIIRMRPQMNE